ncbi:hypothetical protein Taro_010293 [Colocasia esculenta]|uniref:Uncharacterized protein n=1 Tax=Colocasia esculenta TaxID=4460 RepID=A0A843U2W0_COLES|nr:hypothetical protein [Colocasia esculenta]
MYEVDSHTEDSSEDSVEAISFRKLKELIKRHWLMAHTCRPRYVISRLATCTSSGPFCLLGALVLSQALLQVLLRRPGLRFCNGASDYGWSTTLVLTTQVAAVILGTVAPVYRWFYAVNFRSIRGKGWTCADEFTVEEYWVERLKDLKEAPPSIDIFGRTWLMKRVAHHLKRCFMAIPIRLQEGVVLSTDFSLSLQDYLEDYVLHLEGVGGLARTVKSEMKDTESWIEKGRMKQPEALLQLIQNHSTFSEGFKHAGAFDRRNPCFQKSPRTAGL